MFASALTPVPDGGTVAMTHHPGPCTLDAGPPVIFAPMPPHGYAVP